MLGTTVDGRYEVIARLGLGGMGSVYRVRHVALRRELAMKVLRSDLASEPPLAERFLREAQSAVAIRHPGICEITDFGQTQSGQPYFVMELLSGKSLAWWLKQDGRFKSERATEIARRVARALQAAHVEGIIHRDLKPDNILLESPYDDYAIKVVDFGLARIAGQSRLTRPGRVYGTPHYMSPEQAGGETVDTRTDVYALGVVLYEMLTGKVPFDGDTFLAVLTAHMYREPEPPTAVTGDSSLAALEAVVLRCLVKTREGRYQSMGEVAEALDALVEKRPEYGSNLPMEESDEQSDSGSTSLHHELRHLRRSPWKAVGAIVAGLSVGLGLAWLSGYDRSGAATQAQAELSAPVRRPPASQGAERGLTEAREAAIAVEQPAIQRITVPVATPSSAPQSRARRRAEPARLSAPSAVHSGSAQAPASRFPPRSYPTGSRPFWADEIVNPWRP